MMSLPQARQNEGVEKRERGKRRWATAFIWACRASPPSATGGAHAPPRQVRSTRGATVAGLVAPTHVACQRGTVVPSATKRVTFANTFFRLVLKYLFKMD